MLVGQLYKIGHRAAWQQQRQQQSEQVLNQLQARYPGQLLITAGLPDELRALAPFKNYTLGPRPVLLVTGWQTLDPHYPAYWWQLAGSAGLGETIARLSQSTNVIWVASPAFVAFLQNYLAEFYGISLRFRRLEALTPAPAPEKLYFYRVQTTKIDR